MRSWPRKKRDGRRSTRERDRRQAGTRRHSRYRVRGAVPAAPVRRRRTVGASRRHAAGAGAPAGQRLSLRRRIRAARLGVPVSARTWSIACSSPTIFRPTRCPQTRPRSSCWPGACPARAAARRHGCSLKLRRHFEHVIEIYERVVHSAHRRRTAPDARWRAAEQRGSRAGSARAGAVRRRWRASGSAPRISRFRAFSGTPVRRSRAAGTAQRRPRADRANARSVRTQPVLRRRADPHAGAGGRNRQPTRRREPRPRHAPSCAAGFAARCCAFRPTASANRIPSSRRSARTSELADTVIARAYEIAIAEDSPRILRRPRTSRRIRCG